VGSRIASNVNKETTKAFFDRVYLLMEFTLNTLVLLLHERAEENIIVKVFIEDFYTNLSVIGAR
jgi:hypothetical protein